MVTPEQIAALEALLAQARQAHGVELEAIRDTITVGDVVQLRPHADAHWGTSLVLVSRLHDDGAISGQILRPHRGGCREAWYRYRPPCVVRVGHMPYPEPPLCIRAWNYDGPECPICGRVDRRTFGLKVAK